MSFLVAGALPLFGQGAFSDGRIVLPALGGLLAILAVLLGRRRAHRLRADPRAEVILLGCATAGFAMAIVVFGVI